MIPVLALQVWDGFGWAGQAVFTWRILHQWIASERARESVLPPSFWAWSCLGTALLLVYALHRRDPVFVLGALVNGALYVRNLAMSRRAARPARARAPWALLAALVLFGVLLAVEAAGVQDRLRGDIALPLLAAGFLGQALWSGRFVVQWWASERRGESHLPPAFFWMSVVGSACLFAYAVARVDWVYVAAYALNPVPYVRNLVLLSRSRGARAPSVPP